MAPFTFIFMIQSMMTLSMMTMLLLIAQAPQPGPKKRPPRSSIENACNGEICRLRSAEKRFPVTNDWNVTTRSVDCGLLKKISRHQRPAQLPPTQTFSTNCEQNKQQLICTFAQLCTFGQYSVTSNFWGLKRMCQVTNGLHSVCTKVFAPNYFSRITCFDTHLIIFGNN